MREVAGEIGGAEREVGVAWLDTMSMSTQSHFQETNKTNFLIRSRSEGKKKI